MYERIEISQEDLDNDLENVSRGRRRLKERETE